MSDKKHWAVRSYGVGETIIHHNDEMIGIDEKIWERITKEADKLRAAFVQKKVDELLSSRDTKKGARA